ncbi:site-specific integrase [Actinoallomurus bryophytorum]|uniref:Phage integrase family protein n=1 Tax=Actinoallomurus bryophytorum TaxID=1490222 RepID=A0A543CL60_9ACTN|nr:site-specific integrase [Actinoallomurus bryophytorum]TQL97833.1 phage integrase family protein [Actinoallomurus bryophytorum]
MARGNKDGRRRFGLIRELPSGRYQASYLGPDGQRKYAPETFARKSEAERFLNLTEVQILRGDWTDPDGGKVKLSDYGVTWIAQRPNLRIRTRELYAWLFEKHIKPGLGPIPLGKLSTAVVRDWRAGLVAAGVSQSMAAKAYRLLRAILMTAVEEDGILPRNPCRIKGAGTENAPERPVLNVAQVIVLADLVGRRPVGNIRKKEDGFWLRYRVKNGLMRAFPDPFASRAKAERVLFQLMHDGRADYTRDDRYRALVLLSAFASLRWGEVTALHRQDLDLENATVRVRVAYTEQDNGTMVLGPPKSRAGVRTVNIPRSLIPDLRAHLDKYTENKPSALVFRGIKGGPLRRSNFNKSTRWVHVVAVLGVPGLHFHDLRHTGNMLAAATGATTKDLMRRMGQDSERAALIYQHATNKADQVIAQGLDVLLKAQRDEPGEDGDDGAAGALVPVA